MRPRPSLPTREPAHSFEARDDRIVRAVQAALVIALAALFVVAPQVPIAVLLAVLGALALDSVAAPLRQRIHLSRPMALGVIALLSLATLVLVGVVWGPRVVDQVRDLGERLPAALNRVQDWLAQRGWAPALSGEEGAGWSRQRLASLLSHAWGPVANAFAGALSALSGALVVLVLAFFLAVDPRPYRAGLLHLVRPESRPRASGLLDDLDGALRRWLSGRGISMAVVAVLTVVGLLALGVPNALVLAVLAGLLSFIPFLGPVLAAAPAMLVAVGEEPRLALWVGVLYLAIQVVEGNLLTPLVERRALAIPPAVSMVAQLLFGFLYGMLGVLVATPLAVIAIVLLQHLYVRGELHDPVPVLGSSGE